MTLTPKQRAVLVLRYYEDLTEAEITQALGVGAGTVKSQAHVGLRRLREALEAARCGRADRGARWTMTSET